MDLMPLETLIDWLEPHLQAAASDGALPLLIDAALDAGAPWLKLEVPSPDRATALRLFDSSRTGMYATWWRSPAGPDCEEFAGWGALDIVRPAGSDRFAAAAQALSVRPADDSRYFGGFHFDDDRESGPFFSNELVLHHVCWSQDADGRRMVVRGRVEPGDDVAAWIDRLTRALNEVGPDDASAHARMRASVRSASAGSLERFKETVTAILQEIDRGRVSKVVAARVQTFDDPAPASPATIVERLVERFPMCTVYAFGSTAELFVGATPELLLKHDGQGGLRSMALAGTAVVGNVDELVESGERLLQSEKDALEHALVREFIQEKFASQGATSEEGDVGLLRLPGLIHLHTPITGRIDAADAAALLGSLHPTPAVCGLPTAAARQILSEHEPLDRGWYSAPVGWMRSDGAFDFRVALRCALICPPTVALFAGAGIVAGSDVEREFRETEGKMLAMRSVVGRERA
jgi:salicylate biosynthesis isochorismate synthase